MILKNNYPVFYESKHMDKKESGEQEILQINTDTGPQNCKYQKSIQYCLRTILKNHVCMVPEQCTVSSIPISIWHLVGNK